MGKRGNILIWMAGRIRRVGPWTGVRVGRGAFILVLMDRDKPTPQLPARPKSSHC